MEYTLESDAEKENIIYSINGNQMGFFFWEQSWQEVM